MQIPTLDVFFASRDVKPKATASGHVELILPAEEMAAADVAWPRISTLPSSKVQRPLRGPRDEGSIPQFECG